ncbi:MAG: hypothetical protein HYY24_19585 [Verrucomicrobia bacterium]|nr:hypothetical protein [Verrucomicrobiota bacterium]
MQARAGSRKHLQEAKGHEATMMRACERPDGGRGFDFTGGHKHVNAANDNFRKVVLNALLLIAEADLPPNSVFCGAGPSGSAGKDQSVKFSFRVSRDGQEGTVIYTGKVENSAVMKGTVKFGDLGEGTWTATK